MTALVPVAAWAQSSNANSDSGKTAAPAAAPAPVLDEYTQLVQQFVAKRDAMNEVRAAALTKAKTAKTVDEKKIANDEVKKVQSDFLKDNAALIGKLKAIDDQKKNQRPSNGG